MDTAQLHRALEAPAAFPDGARVGKVEVVETHLSRLYFVGERVYKVKKAVDLGFVDFSTLAKRKFACDEEVRLNRRLAPDTYLGVRPIVRDAAGAVRVGGEGVPIEYAVEMERLPAARMLDAMLERGEIDRELVDRIVERLAEFHARAARGPDVDRLASPDAIARRVAENLDESVAAARRFDAAEGAAAPCLPPRVAALLRGAFERFAAEQHARFVRRVAEGRVCEGHGDLHAGNLCILPDRVVAFDCIEFSRPLRCLDVAADLAFLLMDLDRRGFPAFARDLARRYAARARDPELASMVAYYKAHLACVRGKVAALRGLGAREASVRTPSRREAGRCFALAAGYALPPFLVATCGLPASGKSFVARATAPLLDALHLQSDVERKRIAGVAPTQRVAGSARGDVYSAAMTERTYASLFDEARSDLAHGRRVLLDATFSSSAMRVRADELARAAGVPLVWIACAADDAETRRRLAARAHDRDEVSDADLAVYEQARLRFEPPDEIAADRRVDAGADATGESVAIACVDRVAAQLASAGRLPSSFPTG